MSEEVWKEIGFFALIFAVIFGFWLITGGPQRASSKQGVFIEPISPGSSAVIYGPNGLPKNTIATTTIVVPGLK